jgi:hypothetical protein
MISVIMPGTESIFFGYMLTLDCQWICKIFWQKSKLKIMARNVQFKDTTQTFYYLICEHIENENWLFPFH